MWRNIIGISVYQLIVCIVFMFKGKDLLDIKCPYVAATATTAAHYDCHHQTLELNGFIFNTFVMMQVFSEINCRRISDINVFANIHKSSIFCGIIVLTVGVQTLFIEAVGATVVGPAIGFVDQTPKQWLISMIIGVIVLPVGTLTRFLPLQWFPGVTDEESNAAAMKEARERVAEAESRMQTQQEQVAVDVTGISLDKKIHGIGEAIVGSRLKSRQSRLSDVSDVSSTPRREKSFKVFAHAVIAAKRFQQAPK